MRLICVNELKDVATFTSELKELFAIMAYRKDKRGIRYVYSNSGNVDRWME